MTIIDVYSQQYAWRSWPTILAALPDLNGQSVLDLGCGVGDLAVDLAARGASVIGVDVNEELVTHAIKRHIPNAEFRQSDLRTFRDSSLCVDGIWSSFTVAYFPALCDTLALWLEHLRPGGWLALTEVDDFFGHHPLPSRTTEMLGLYVQSAMEHSRYDFQMGRKMSAIAERVGLRIVRQFTVPDDELSFTGRAAPEVRKAWASRFEQMHLLQTFCGAEFPAVRGDFLSCLDRDDHFCSATVQCCIAIKQGLTLTNATEQSDTTRSPVSREFES